MTKLKKVLSKIYYYTWRILLIIILSCLSVYSVANTVNYFIDRNKQVESSYRQKQNIINPSNNPQGLSLSCPITNYMSYRPNQDQSSNFVKIYDEEQSNTFCYSNYVGNVLTFKDFSAGSQTKSFRYNFSLEYLIPNEDYIFGIKVNGNYYYDAFITVSGNSHDYFDGLIDNFLGINYLDSLSSSDSLDFIFLNDGYDFIQFEFYLFLIDDINSHFDIDINSDSFNDFLYLISSQLFIPYGREYFQGGGNNSFYDAEYVLNYNTERYYTGYDTGYSAGSLSGYNEGYVDGKQDGESIGYDRGYYDGSTDDTSQAFQNGYNAGLTAQFNKGGFLGLANLIFNAPYNILHEVFNFEFLGVNLWGLMSFAFTTALVFAVIKLFM